MAESFGGHEFIRSPFNMFEVTRQYTRRRKKQPWFLKNHQTKFLSTETTQKYGKLECHGMTGGARQGGLPQT